MCNPFLYREVAAQEVGVTLWSIPTEISLSLSSPVFLVRAFPSHREQWRHVARTHTRVRMCVRQNHNSSLLPSDAVGQINKLRELCVCVCRCVWKQWIKLGRRRERERIEEKRREEREKERKNSKLFISICWRGMLYHYLGLWGYDADFFFHSMGEGSRPLLWRPLCHGWGIDAPPVPRLTSFLFFSSSLFWLGFSMKSISCSVCKGMKSRWWSLWLLLSISFFLSLY